MRKMNGENTSGNRAVTSLLSFIDSHYKLGAGQLRECSRYGYTDSFGKNDVYQVGCYGKRGQLRVYVFWCGIPL